MAYSSAWLNSVLMTHGKDEVDDEQIRSIGGQDGRVDDLGRGSGVPHLSVADEQVDAEREHGVHEAVDERGDAVGDEHLVERGQAREEVLDRGESEIDNGAKRVENHSRLVGQRQRADGETLDRVKHGEDGKKHEEHGEQSQRLGVLADRDHVDLGTIAPEDNNEAQHVDEVLGRLAERELGTARREGGDNARYDRERDGHVLDAEYLPLYFDRYGQLCGRCSFSISHLLFFSFFISAVVFCCCLFY